MAQTPNKLKHGHVDDNALTFAIFTHDGRMVLNDGDNGEIIIAINGKVLLTGNWWAIKINGVLSG